MRKSLMPFTPRVVANLRAIIIQYRLLPPAVLETMQMDDHPRRMQHLDLLKKVKHPAVIDRVRHIQTHNM
jgi:hypothetical protein